MLLTQERISQNIWLCTFQLAVLGSQGVVADSYVPIRYLGVLWREKIGYED